MSKPIIANYRNIETFPKDVAVMTTSSLRLYQSKSWYVRFRFYDSSTSSWKLIIRKCGINYKAIPLAERKAQLLALKKAVEYKLEQEGWNPITNEYPEKTLNSLQLEHMKAMPFMQALQFAYDKKSPDWSHKTKQDYKSVLKFFNEGARALGMHNRRISDVQRLHCRLLLDKVKEIRTLSPNGYNKYRETLSSFFSELEEFDVVEYNPVHKIKSKEEVKVFAHKPPTVVQKDVIINKIKKDYRNYYRFICVLYGCTIRPKEITRLRIKDLVREEQLFRIIPDKKEGNSKTNIQRDVVIPDWLLTLLDELHLDRCHPEWYIFSGKAATTMFTPGPYRMHANSPTRWWRDIVKEGLGLNITQYSLKKLSGNDMVKLQYAERMGDLLEMPRMQMGHTNSKMTEVYVDAHKKIINDMIKKKMPEL